MAQFLIQKVSEETGESPDDITADAEFYADLLLVAEHAKQTLTSREVAKEPLMYGGERIRAEITRDEFNDITRHLLDRTIETTRSVVDRAAMDSEMNSPTKILLVGGSTFMPQVKERLQQEFPDLPISQQDPNQIVAKGAAIFGLKMVLEDKAIEIINERGGKEIDDITDADRGAVEDALAKAGQEFGLAPNAAVDLGSTIVTNVTSRSFGISTPWTCSFKNRRIKYGL